jgi:glucokinase
MIADIGGTNARFGIARAGQISHVRVLRTADFPTMQDAARAFLEGLPPDIHVTEALLDMAGPVVGDHAQLTNNAWAFSIPAARTELGLRRLRVLNDFAAAALGIPMLPREDFRQIGGGEPEPEGAIGVIGPGTGLGVAGLVRAEGRWQVIPGEGGHVTVPAASEEETRIIDHLRARFGHVSAERVISGQGIENLYEAAEALAGRPGRHRAAAEITKAGIDGSDASAARALDLFCDMLGTVAGNLALTLGASGGIYLVGGILPRIGDRLAASGFRARFEAKGRLSDYLRPKPTYLVAHENPAMLGLASVA